MQKKNKNYYKFLLKEHRAYVILVPLIYFVVVVLPVIMDLVTAFNNMDDPNSAPAVSEYLINVSNTNWLYSLAIITVILMMVTPFVVFKYLYNKNSMDKYFSLPIERGSLFLKQITFGYLLTLIPAVISYVLVLILKLSFIPNMQINFNDVVLRILVLLMGFLISYVVTVIAILCTTTLANGILYTLVLQSIPNLIIGIYLSFKNSIYGATSEKRFIDDAILNWDYKTLSVDALTSSDFSTNFIKVVIWFILALILTVLAVYIYRNHKVERIASNYMVKGFYPTVISIYGIFGLTISISALIREAQRTGVTYALKTTIKPLLVLFFLALVVYAIVQMIRLHGRPKFFRTLVSYILIFAVSLGLAILANKALVFDQESEIVDLDKVDKIVLYLPSEGTNNYFDEKDIPRKDSVEYFGDEGYLSPINELSIDDVETQVDIQSFHKQIIAKYKKDKNAALSFEDEVITPMKILYVNKEGKILQAREYTLHELEKQDLEAILGVKIPDYQEIEGGFVKLS